MSVVLIDVFVIIMLISISIFSNIVKGMLKMEENNIEKLLTVSESVDSVILLSKLAESAIENDAVEKTWDLYILFGTIRKLCTEALRDLREIQEDF